MRMRTGILCNVPFNNEKRRGRIRRLRYQAYYGSGRRQDTICWNRE